MSYLSVAHLEKSFGSTRVLRDVSFDLPEGETLPVIGSSGSGKTTLLRCLNFLERPDAGVISLRDQTLLDGSRPPVRERELREKRLHFGLVFQDFNLYATSVAENVSMNQNPDLEKVRDALICARIPKAADRLDGIISKEFCADGIDFSGGERQRIGLARAFLHDADLMLLDEPTSNLDSLNEGVILKALKEEQKDKTVVLVSHRESTMRIADCVCSVENGRMS